MQKIRQDKCIGNNIRQIRTTASYTQEQVVAHLQLQGLDISRSIYSQIECGTYNIKVSELIELKNLFGVGYDEFFEGL